MAAGRDVVALALWLFVLFTVSFLASSRRMRDDLADDVFAPQRRGAGMDYGGRRGGGNGNGKKHHQLPPPERKPNIILILTDDQDVELGSLNFMPRTLRLLRDGGAEFRHAYVTTPMCCPSRSSLLTGMYVHNHHVFTNNDNCSSATWQATHETRSFATYLSNAGYRTGYFGKYLNKYNGSYIPPGWREWGGLIMNSRYYNYSINLNGKKIKHGADYHKDYYPDLIANDSVTFLRQSKQYFSKKPVMLVLSFPAPHGPEDSAPQFSHLFFNVTTHHTPAYDYAPNPDKQWILKVTPRMQPIHRQFTDLLMTKRLQTLQSVDEAVEKIYQELKDLRELDNTYIIYTSDHGYHLGQFGLVKGKSFPFEFDVRVPFLVRGPDIEPGTIIDDIVLNLDLAPTFLDIAGVEPPAHMDGRSFLKLLHRNPKHGQLSRRKKLKWPDTFLIESSGRRETPENVEAKLNLLKLQQQAKLGKVAPDSSRGDKISTEYPQSSTDENALNNTANALPVSEDNIAAINRPDLQIDNRVLPVVSPGISKLERIALECQSPDYQAPCKPGQKWQCVSEGNRWRKHKCKFQSTTYPRGGTGGKRKCACFTPAGLVYTRLEPDERRMQRQFLRGHVNKNIKEYKPKFLRTVQAKRIGEVDLADLLHQSSGLLDEDAVADFMARYSNHDIKRRGSRRSKRDTLENLADSIMKDLEKDIEKELHGLQEKDIDGNSGVPSDAENMIQLAGCAVSPSHTVNCSNAVYEDLPTWRSSKSNVDDAIRKLLAQVEILKEIRRHLREKRPQDTSSYDASAEEVDEENTEDEDENDETGGGEDADLSLEEAEEKVKNEEGILIGSEKEDNNHTKTKDHRKVHRVHKHPTTSTTEDYVSTESSHRFAATTEYTTTTMHHRHHHTSYPLTTSAPEDNLTTAQPAHVRAPVEITWREYLDLNISTEGPSTVKPQHKLRLPKPTNNENKLAIGPSRIDVTVYQPQRPNNGRAVQENSSITEASSSNYGGRVFSLFPTDGQGQHTCYCEPDNKIFRNEEKEIAKEARQRIKEERLKKKERKLKKKAKLEKECLAEKMNCFNHDNDHWKTAPLWTEGPFCFCMNANNNTYSCLRTINATHNFLYCEFVTGLVTFYNLRIDPFEQWNRVHSLTEEELRYLRDQLAQLKACRGTKQCTVGSAATSSSISHSAGNTATLTNASRYKKRKYANAGLYGPSPAMHLASQSHLLPPTNKKRKKLPKPWRRRKAWQNQWHQRRRRFRQYFQQYQQ